MKPHRATKFAEIRAVQQVRGALKTAISLRFPVLVVGDSGLGKTTALEKVADETGAAYCVFSQYTKDVKGMFRMLLSAYGVRASSHFTYELGEQCLRDLDNSDARMPALLADEYQNLTPTVLRELLHIHEHCGFPLLLAGNRARIAGTKKDAGALDQIQTRIGMRVHIERPTLSDWTSIGVEYNVEGKDAYSAVAKYGAHTSIRELCFLLDACIASAGNIGSIQLRHIESAAVALHGSHAALKLLSTSPST